MYGLSLALVGLSLALVGSAGRLPVRPARSTLRLSWHVSIGSLCAGNAWWQGGWLIHLLLPGVLAGQHPLRQPRLSAVCLVVEVMLDTGLGHDWAAASGAVECTTDGGLSICHVFEDPGSTDLLILAEHRWHMPSSIWFGRRMC